MDAGVQLVWQGKQEGRKDAALDACRRLGDLLDETWAEGERACGLLVVAAAAVWAGDGSLFEDSRNRLRQLLNSVPRIEHGDYRYFHMVPASGSEPDHYSTRAGRNLRFVPGDRSCLEQALATLVAAKHADTALELFTRMQSVLNPMAAVRAMAAQAAEIGDPDLYHDLLRLHAGVQEVEPELTRSGSAYDGMKRTTPLVPILPHDADLQRALRWLRTVLLAARFEGPVQVWRHICDFAPLLRAFPRGTAQRVRGRLLAIERLHAPPQAAEPDK